MAGGPMAGGKRMRERMVAGEVLLGVGTRLARSTEIAALAAAAGLDWLFIDMEHNPISADLACELSVAAASAGVTPLVRVPGKDPTVASRLLDAGAGGIVVPHVDRPEEIMPFVERCRFAPQGRRSLGGVLPQLAYASLPASEAMSRANEETLICPMIESPEAVANARAIAAVPGVDMLLFGSNDLAIEMGIPGKLDSPRVGEAYRKVIADATAEGRVVGLGGVYSRELLERYLPLGFRFALLGSDLAFVLSGMRAQVAVARAIASIR